MTHEERLRARMIASGQIRPGDASGSLDRCLSPEAIKALKLRLIKAGLLRPKFGARVLSIETGCDEEGEDG